MYKPIPGMLNTCVTDTLEFCTGDGDPLHFPEKDGKVQLDRCGRVEWYDKEFIKLCAWFEVPVFVRLETVRFVKLDNIRKSIPYRAFYTVPYYYDAAKKFRVCPMFPRYAVSADGIVINMIRQRIVPQYVLYHGYRIIHGFEPLTQDTREIFVHLLVASAWVGKGIKNGLLVSVNHIDGIRTNNASTNLEWCTAQYNVSDSARRTRLRKQYVGRVRDIKTGEISSFKTYQEMATFMGMNVHGKNKFCKARINKLFKGRYEVRLTGDDRPWFYMDGVVQNIATTRYIITVHEPTGVRKIFNGIIKLKEFYGMRTTLHDTESVVNLFRQSFPGYSISYVDLSPKVEFQVLNVKTGTVRVFKSIAAIAVELSIPVDRVYDLVVSNGKLSSFDIRARRFTEDPWPDEYKTTISLSKIRYRVEDSLTNTVTYFKTLTEASLCCQCSVRSLRRMVQKKWAADRYLVSIEPVT